MPGTSGNAATRLEVYAISGGTFAYGGYAEIDGLFREQSTQLDRAKREAALHAFSSSSRSGRWSRRSTSSPSSREWAGASRSRRSASSRGYAFSAPYEDVKLRAK